MTFRTLMPDEVKDGMKPRQQRDEKGKERMKDRKKLVVSKPFDIFSVSPCVFVTASRCLRSHLLRGRDARIRKSDSFASPRSVVALWTVWYSPPTRSMIPTVVLRKASRPRLACAVLSSRSESGCCVFTFAGDVLTSFASLSVLGFHGGDLLREEGEPGLTYALIRKDDSSAPTSPLSPPVSPLSPSEYEERGRAGAPRRPFEFFRTESSERMATLSTSVAAMRVNSSSSLNSEVFRQG